MIQLISFTLQGAGYNFLELLDRTDTIAKMRDNKIDMVTTDLNMPNTGGMELLKYLRSHCSFKSIPVEMLTTESEFSTVVEAKNAGINGLIIKPFEL